MNDMLQRLRAALQGGQGDSEAILGRRVGLARLILIFERVWRALLWPFLVVGCFLIVSLIGLWEILPHWAHNLGIAALALAFAVSLVPLLRISLPTREEALRRLERDSGVKHRPATAYEDTLAKTTSPTAQALWQQHRERLSRLVSTLKPGAPRPGIARFDPYAIRALVLLLIVATAFIAGRGGWDRLAAAFTYGSEPAEAGYRLDAWVTPPLYTGLPPVVLADGKANSGSQGLEPITVPEGSQLMVRVNGAASQRAALEYAQAQSGDQESMAAATRNEELAEYKVSLDKAGSATVTSPAAHWASGTSKSPRTAIPRSNCWSRLARRRAKRYGCDTR